ncbi:MAG: hypothetical protein WGN25_09300 [Candidatus Electrothrix sp. GW3-4]|uniref:hypothetical protein n=1 Tax=Candidatus Electrothrix sp. GW3-4 TaxID=3126740 RepID=UPI0030CFB411
MQTPKRLFSAPSSPVMLAVCCVLLAFGTGHAEVESQAKALFYNPNSGTNSGVISGNVVQAPGGGTGGQYRPASGGSGGAGQAYTGISNYYDRLKNPGMHYWIELSRPGSSMIQRVSDRRVFRSGEKIRIHLSANVAGTILVHHTGSSGREKTFPVAAKGGVTMGKQYVIPSANGWLRFDNNKGGETLRLILLPGQAGQAHVGASGAEFNRLYDNYSQSKSLLESVVSGTKDLVLEGASGFYTAPALRINRKSSSYTGRISTPVTVANDPGRYVVNTAGEPVAMEIQLKHQ